MLCTFCPPTILGDFYTESQREKCTEHVSKKIRSSKKLFYIIHKLFYAAKEKEHRAKKSVVDAVCLGFARDFACQNLATIFVIVRPV